ncbi:MAG TPA: TylF/MycF/NovP-related O-methyltransferase [Gaiellaceae bacterium]|jgi:O-methyltransferase
MGSPESLYLDLLAKSLTHTLYGGADAVGFTSPSRIRRKIFEILERRGIVPVRIIENQDRQRAEGRINPLFAHTMVGIERLGNLRSCLETVLADNIPGDVIETGVWRGGASIFARGVLKAYGITDRTVWVADSFKGLPEPDPRYPADAESLWHTADHLRVSLEAVQENFRSYDLLDDQVRFVEGWFRDTLPGLRDQTWSVIRLDGDMYESTMDALTNLYPGLSPGGFLIVDDFEIDMCRQAVEDFREANRITEPIEHVDWTGVYWRRTPDVQSGP